MYFTEHILTYVPALPIDHGGEKMRENGEERPLKSFIIPNESFKWDFILDMYAYEDETKREGLRRRRKTKRADRRSFN